MVGIICFPLSAVFLSWAVLMTVLYTNDFAVEKCGLF